MTDQPEEPIEDDNDPTPTPGEDFRQAFRDAMRGNTHPISELWEGLADADED